MASWQDRRGNPHDQLSDRKMSNLSHCQGNVKQNSGKSMNWYKTVKECDLVWTSS